MNSLKLNVKFWFFLINAQAAFGCNGYKLIINRIVNCNPNNIIKMDKVNFRLDSSCNIIPSGCIITTRGYTTAQVHYVLQKAHMQSMERDENLCTVFANAKNRTKMFQLPEKCPVRAGKVCGDASKKFSIAEYKNRLNLASGNFTLKSFVTHNNGVSCFDLHWTLKKQ